MVIAILAAMGAHYYTHHASTVLTDHELGEKGLFKGKRLFGMVPHPWMQAGRAHRSMPSHSLFTESGVNVVTASHDGVIKVWQRSNGALLARISLPGATEQAVADAGLRFSMLGLAVSEKYGPAGNFGLNIASRWLAHPDGGEATLNIGQISILIAELNPDEPVQAQLTSSEAVPIPAWETIGLPASARMLAWHPQGFVIYPLDGGVLNRFAGESTPGASSGFAMVQFPPVPTLPVEPTISRAPVRGAFRFDTQAGVTAMVVDEKSGQIHFGMADGSIVKAARQTNSATPDGPRSTPPQTDLGNGWRVDVFRAGSPAPVPTAATSQQGFDQNSFIDIEANGQPPAAGRQPPPLPEKAEAVSEPESVPVDPTESLNGTENQLAPVADLQMEGDTLFAFHTDGVVTRIEQGVATLIPATGRISHEDIVWSAAFSPDGTRIVTASEDKTARLWNVTTGVQIGEPLRHKDRVQSAAFSPDGTRIVTASWDSTARLWDAATGMPIGEPMRHEGDVWSAAFSSDGTRIVTASWDRTARLWDGTTGAPIAEAMRHKDSVLSAAFSPDGTRIVTASWDNTARIWDAATGAPVGESMRHEERVTSAAFSPDGTRIAVVSEDPTVHIWDAATGKLTGDALLHDWVANSAAFSPDGSKIVTASSSTAGLWDTQTGAPIGEPMRHENTVYSAAFSPDGTRIVTASVDKTAGLWDAGTQEEILFDCGACQSLAVDPTTQRLARVGESRRLAIVNPQGNDPALLLESPETVSHVFFAANDNQIVTLGDDGVTRIWNSASGSLLHRFSGHRHHIRDAAMDSSRRFLLTVDFEGRAIVSDLKAHSDVGPLDRAVWAIQDGVQGAVRSLSGAFFGAAKTNEPADENSGSAEQPGENASIPLPRQDPAKPDLPAGSDPSSQVTRKLGQFAAWGAFQWTSDQGNKCFVGTMPNSKMPDNFDHGNVFLLVSFSSSNNEKSVITETQINIDKEFSEEIISLKVGNNFYEFFTIKTDAWIVDKTKEEELNSVMLTSKMISMEATLKENNLKVIYQFSLDGLSDAMKRAKECG